MITASNTTGYLWAVCNANDSEHQAYDWDTVRQHAAVVGENTNSITITPTDTWLNGKVIGCPLTGEYGTAVSDYVAMTVTAPIPDYAVTVTNGTASIGGGAAITKATADTVVTLTANPPAASKQFKNWTVSGVTPTNVNSATTTFTMPAGAVTATANYEDVTVSSIAVNSTTHKTAYTVDDALDVSNLTIEVTKSDNSKTTVPVTSNMITGFNSASAVASQTLTITYEGKTTTYNISVTSGNVPTAPTITTQPTDQSVTEGEIARFSVTVSANPAATCQWQINLNDGNGWVAITGAITANYNTSITTLSDNGNSFRCVVTNKGLFRQQRYQRCFRT